ncbi:hypothetical protein [Mycobacterium sp. AZCC_0083]|uniref:hypothetical protein n=1 Tax=Mycobacterium sp. AZCC_0083 TaxID=2735882 RepID=UPI0016158D8B|nr:hypothetical protein [Mycobacterium sp. AZCC_0083]MBB5164116.1 hypothetical protein [Mycobacterium sp. AZCC_0083]
MTTSYVSPNHHPHVDHDAQTVHRPQMTFVPQIGPVPPPASSPSSTWKAGWVMSGLAAFVAVASLAVVGGAAFSALTQSDPGPAASVSSPAAPPSGVAVVAPAPLSPAPVVTANPAMPAPVAGVPRIVVVPVPVPAPAPAAQADAIVTPPEPSTPPKPPLGIGTCDLVACDPKPAPPPPGIPKCGDLVACDPAPPQNPNPLPKCGDLVACTPIPSRP